MLDELREKHKTYQKFVEALKESIKLVTGRNPKDLKSIWFEWQRIFEASSL